MSARLLVALAVGLPLAAQQNGDDRLALEILRELVGIRSSAAYPQNTMRLLEGVAARLRREGFNDEQITLVPVGEVAALVVRYPGSGQRKPLLAMAHVDVVDADPGAWQADPFTLAEIDGYYYGRGTLDNKTGAASLITALIRMKREGYTPDRDIVMVLTGDEETEMATIAHLALDRRDLVDAELALNTDVGGVRMDRNGASKLAGVQMSEKLYQSFEIEATNPGGHSSRPRADNAIYDLAWALSRIERHAFPAEVNPVVRGMLKAMAMSAPPDKTRHFRSAAADPPEMKAVKKLAQMDPAINASVRTTCVATMLSAGVAENALPRRATATVNCRLLPGDTPANVLRVLRGLVAERRIVVRPVGELREASPASPVRADVMATVRSLTAELFAPDVAVVPQQSTGATDGRWLRQVGIPVYGFSAIATEPSEARAHGLDERVPVESFRKAVRFWHRLLREMSSGNR